MNRLKIGTVYASLVAPKDDGYKYAGNHAVEY